MVESEELDRLYEQMDEMREFEGHLKDSLKEALAELDVLRVRNKELGELEEERLAVLYKAREVRRSK